MNIQFLADLGSGPLRPVLIGLALFGMVLAV